MSPPTVPEPARCEAPCGRRHRPATSPPSSIPGGDGAPPWTARVAIDGLRGLIEHDLAPLRAALSDDFVLDDQRRAGLGRIEGADLFARSFEALFEQSEDLATESLHTIAIAAHGILDMAHMFGTLSASGGDFESVYLRILVVEAGRLVRLELFEPDDLATARAHFEALCAARA